MEAEAAREEEEEREKAAAAIKEVHDKLDALVMQDEEPKDAATGRAAEESKDTGNGLRKIDTMRKSNKKKRNRKSKN